MGAGLFQLENYRLKSGRWKNLDTFAKARGKSWDDASSQLDFMIYEASGGEPFIANNIKSITLMALMVLNRRRI